MGILSGLLNNIHAMDALQFNNYLPLSARKWVKNAHMCVVIAPIEG